MTSKEATQQLGVVAAASAWRAICAFKEGMVGEGSTPVPQASSIAHRIQKTWHAV
jgi:hypothetical protein